MGTKGITTIGVIGLVASLGAVQFPAQAPAQTPAQVAAPRPAGGVRELRQVLYDMADAIGMLRTAQEVDRLGSMNYWATGTIVSGGQSCKVVDYKASVNWLLKGMRVDYKCEGSAQRHVEVVRDASAWNETEPGKGGTPAAAVAGERALMLWTLPAGAIKAANQAGAAAKVALEGGKTTVTFPIAALSATMKLTLNADNHIEQVETRVGQTTTVTTFAEVRRLERRRLPQRRVLSKADRTETGNSDGRGFYGHQDQHVQPVRHHAVTRQYRGHRPVGAKL